MIHWIEAGGVGQYGTLALGASLLFAAAAYAVRAQPARLRMTIALGAATLLHGVATCVEGFTQSLQGAGMMAHEQERWKVVLLGASETLTNLTLATLLVMLAALVVAAGEWRHQRQSAPVTASPARAG